VNDDLTAARAELTAMQFSTALLDKFSGKPRHAGRGLPRGDQALCFPATRRACWRWTGRCVAWTAGPRDLLDGYVADLVAASKTRITEMAETSQQDVDFDKKFREVLLLAVTAASRWPWCSACAAWRGWRKSWRAGRGLKIRRGGRGGRSGRRRGRFRRAGRARRGGPGRNRRRAIGRVRGETSRARAEGEDDGANGGASWRERRAGFVNIEGEARGGGGDCCIQILDTGGEGVVARDRGDVGGEGLGRAFAQALLPFAGFPQCAVGVGRLAFFGVEEVQGGDAEGRALAQEVTRGLRAGHADDDVERAGRLDLGSQTTSRRRPSGPSVRRVALPRGPLDRSDEEHIARFHAQHVADVHGARVAGGEAGGIGGGFEEDEVSRQRAWQGMSIFHDCGGFPIPIVWRRGLPKGWAKLSSAA